MTDPKVIIVVLRRPGRDDQRDDPFWEFGSFGCTKCHRRNLMNPNKIDQINKTRLAFAQGGPDGFRLVLLTPPVKAIEHGDFCEARWSPVNMPFKYNRAPLLIKNGGKTDFPLIGKFIELANCKTEEARFASKFRSRRKPLDPKIAAEIARVFDRKAKTNKPDAFISSYVEALPYQSSTFNSNRENTYLSLLGNKKGHNSI